jgi:hypothetical protein
MPCSFVTLVGRPLSFGSEAFQTAYSINLVAECRIDDDPTPAEFKSLPAIFTQLFRKAPQLRNLTVTYEKKMFGNNRGESRMKRCRGRTGWYYRQDPAFRWEDLKWLRKRIRVIAERSLRNLEETRIRGM